MRRPWVIGLIAGSIGGLINLFLSVMIGFCGPFWALAVGAVAGYLAGRSAGLGPQRAAVEAGAVAGGVSGAIVLISQIIAAVSAVFLVSFISPGAQIFGGRVPDLVHASSPELVGAAIGGLGVGFCFGLLGAILSAAAGAGMGYAAHAMQPRTSTS